jgi:hypothetical protein
VPIGGIVAGALVGGIAIGAILVFGWYKVTTHRQRSGTQGSVGNQYSPGPSRERKGTVIDDAEMTSVRNNQRYPDIPISANLGAEY